MRAFFHFEALMADCPDGTIVSNRVSCSAFNLSAIKTESMHVAEDSASAALPCSNVCEILWVADRRSHPVPPPSQVKGTWLAIHR